MTDTKKELHVIRYVFSEEEKRDKATQLAETCADKATQLAETCADKARLAEEKKSVASDYKAKIDAKDSTISLLSSHITNGYEHKSVECEVRMIYDKNHKEYWYNGKLYDTRPMSPEDLQMKLDIVVRDVLFDVKASADGKSILLKEKDFPDA